MRASIAFTVLLVGCANSGDEGMFIVNNSSPMGTTCSFTSDPMQPFISHGSLEVNSPRGYILSPLVESRIDDPMKDPATRTIHIEGANVILSKADTSGALTQVTSFTALVSGSVPPLSTVNVSFEVLPASVATSPGEYSANVTLFGTLGGGRLDASPFNYPITVCQGCAIRSIAATCATPPAMIAPGDPCNPFQDGPVDCCMNGTTLVCPAAMM